MFITQRFFKSTLLIGICTFASTFSFPLLAHAWTIDSFDATIEVFDDASILVEEEIQVDFDIDKHGIFRTIPVSYIDNLNNRVRIDLEVLEILQDGELANYVEYKSGPNRVFQIGDGDELIRGEHSYHIRYAVNRALLYFDDYDELYWNVTGNDWEVPIISSSAFVILPDGTEILQTACYTGYSGSTSQNCGIANEDNLSAFVASDYLTIALGFEKGVVVEPSKNQRLLWFLGDNWPSVIPIFVIVFVVVIWWRFGKDEKMETVVAEFSPPNDIWAAYAGIISRSVFVSADIAGMIVQMAVKGYLVFEIEGEGRKRKVTLKKKKDVDGLDPAHTVLFKHLFKSRESVTAKELKGSASANTLEKIRKKLNAQIRKDGIYVKNSRKYRSVMLAFAVALIFSSFVLGTGLGLFTGASFLLAGLITFAFSFFMPKKTLHGLEVARKILGFKLFMHTAERYRSKWQEEKGMFEEFLPYAIVFGDTTKWAKTFSGMEFNNPSWYHSSVAFVGSDVFMKDLISMTHSMARVAAPSSSGSGGSSGGGSSGGGFGGGGGGSW